VSFIPDIVIVQAVVR